jgi:hypothetical protein
MCEGLPPDGVDIASSSGEEAFMHAARWYAASLLVCVVVAMPRAQSEKVSSGGPVSVIGCLQRNDNSGTLDSTIPEALPLQKLLPSLQTAASQRLAIN